MDSLGSQAVDQARRQMQQLLASIEQLAQRDLVAAEFWPEFLTQVVAGMAALGGAVWLQRDGDALANVAQVPADRGGLAISDGSDADAHQQLLARAIGTGQSCCLAPRSESSNGDFGLPNALLLLAVLRQQRSVVGVVEIAQRVVENDLAQQNYLRLLERLCEPAGRFLEAQALREQSEFWGRLQQFIRTIHGSLELSSTAMAVVNEGRRVINCDRMTVVLLRDGVCRVEAISGQDWFDPRSPTVQALERLALLATSTKTSFKYSSQRGHLPPLIEEACESYFDLSNARFLVVVPLLVVRPQTEAPRAEEMWNRRVPTLPPAVPELIGGLIIEQFAIPLAPGADRCIAAVSETSALALANALEHQSLVLLPLSRGMRQMQRLVRRPKAQVIGLLLAAAAAALVLVPADFEMEARGELQPVQRRNVFAATSGIVQAVRVQTGDAVVAGQLLIEMDDSDLKAELARLTGERDSTRERLRVIRQQLLRERRATPDRQLELSNQDRPLAESLRALETQLAIQRSLVELLHVTSPRSGTVLTWNLEELLNNRPVQRGQLLLTVAEPEGPWELEIRMPDTRMGHLRQAQRELQAELPVEFVLATEPSSTLHGTIHEVHDRAEVHERDGNTVLIKVAIDRTAPQQLNAGAEVVARVHCGRRPLGYVWFHEVAEFVRKKILFRL